MLNYQDYEKEVYNWLLAKHKADENFTFSLRKKASKAAERDYFIGTEKSNYFSVTFWTLPIYYAGSSSDCINLIFESKDNLYSYKFDFTQTNTPEEAQNISALNLLKAIQPILKESLALNREASTNNKMFSFQTKPTVENYTDLKVMFKDIEKELALIIKLVGEAIAKEKEQNSNFTAEPISLDAFTKMHDKLIIRRKKHTNKDIHELTPKENAHTPKEKSIHIPLATNQILYGPPGTGKTYATKKIAVELIDSNSYKNTQEDRDTIIKRYNELEKKGQIVFTTFHQSISYEDFVEGIKPKTSEDKKITYEVEDGIFKQLANKAKGLKGEISPENNTLDFKNKNYFKMSIGGKNRKDVHNWCIENSYISLGWGNNKNYSDYNNINNWKEFSDKFKNEFSLLVEDSKYHIQAMFIFQKMNIGDIVLISLGNHIIDAIGIIIGEYEYKENSDIPYHHFRKVKWLATNLDADPSLFVDKKISQQSIYQFYNDDIKVDYLEQTFSKNKEENKTPKNHVLIIDEINRGNVSAIFGELITLLEPNKRLGQKEAITVTLPYSKSESKFGIPSNLHIIGTMNTADRSVEALDTALRRRFEFKETMPDYTVIENEKVNDIHLAEVLQKINQRIEVLLDRDHTIGHSYFIGVDTNKKLTTVFKNKIIPLLQEYFYNDYEKIGLVLGTGFVNDNTEKEKVSFPKFITDVDDLNSEIRYELKNINIEFDIITALQTFLEGY